MSDSVKNHPPIIIKNLICLLANTTDDSNLQGLCITGSKNRDGNTYLPLDPIVDFKCHCGMAHKFFVTIAVENTFYAVTVS